MDLSHLVLGMEGTISRTEFLHYTSQGELEGIRQGSWKLLVRVAAQNRNNAQANVKPPEVLLFDLSGDIGETTNLASAHPDIVDRLRTRMTELDAEITANARLPWMKVD